MSKTETVVTAGVDVQKDRVECSVVGWPIGGSDEASHELIAGSLVAGLDVVESTLSAVLGVRLASCAVAHLLSEATACAEAVKAAFETLRAAPVGGE